MSYSPIPRKQWDDALLAEIQENKNRPYKSKLAFITAICIRVGYKNVKRVSKDRNYRLARKITQMLQTRELKMEIVYTSFTKHYFRVKLGKKLQAKPAA